MSDINTIGVILSLIPYAENELMNLRHAEKRDNECLDSDIAAKSISSGYEYINDNFIENKLYKNQWKKIIDGYVDRLKDHNRNKSDFEPQGLVTAAAVLSAEEEYGFNRVQSETLIDFYLDKKLRQV